MISVPSPPAHGRRAHPAAILNVLALFTTSPFHSSSSSGLQAQLYRYRPFRGGSRVPRGVDGRPGHGNVTRTVKPWPDRVRLQCSWNTAESDCASQNNCQVLALAASLSSNSSLGRRGG